jgi:hypothetical protein
MAGFDRNGLRSRKFPSASIGVLDVDLAAREKADMCVLAQVRPDERAACPSTNEIQQDKSRALRGSPPRGPYRSERPRYRDARLPPSERSKSRMSWHPPVETFYLTLLEGPEQEDTMANLGLRVLCGSAPARFGDRFVEPLCERLQGERRAVPS